MSLNLQATVWAKLTCEVVDANLSERLAPEYWRTFVNGAVSGQANVAYAKAGTLNSGISLNLDLSALVQNLFGQQTERSMSNLKAVLVLNTTENENCHISVGNATGNPVVGIYESTTDRVRVRGGGAFLWTAPLGGIEVVDGASDILRIVNGSAVNATYVVALLGTNGATDLPAMPTMEDDPRFIYGDNGPYDVGLCGNLTYAVSSSRWRGSIAFSWYNFWAESGLGRGCDAYQTNNDVITGLPSAVGIYQGTYDRLRTQLGADALIGFYVTLLQIANTNGQNHVAVSTWPQTRPLWDSEYDAMGAAGWVVSDIGSDGRYIGGPLVADIAANATVRQLQADRCAEIVQTAKAQNPTLNVVFSDNFSAISGDTTWGYLMDLASRFTSQIAPLGVAFIPNITSSTFTGASVGATPGDLSGYWDQAVDAGIAGFYTEGLGHAHLIHSSRFAAMCSNIQNWLARSWPAGGRRALLAQAASGTDSPGSSLVYGLNRRVVVASATKYDDDTLEFVTATEHFAADTSYPTVRFENVHASLGSEYQISVVNDTTFRVTKTAHGLTNASFSLTANSVVHFPHSGIDVDFGVLHMLRAAGDATFCWWNPSAIIAAPLWVDDITTFGEVVPASLSVVSTHTVEGNLCVKEVKYQFASGDPGEQWHHIRFDMEGRRRWKAAS